MDDYKKIKQENREIRKLLEEMKTLLQEASDSEQKYATREQENLAVLAEKQRQLDDLNAQMQLIEEQVSSGALAPAPSTPKTRDELEEWAD
jgi:cell division septum initiation protein DivIVA